MRVALLHPFSWPEVRRGAERYAHDLTWWLTTAGHDVDYVTGPGAGGRTGVEVVDGVRMVRLAARHHRRLAARGVTRMDSFGIAVLPWLARNRYDVVHALVPSAAIAAAAARQRVVYTAIGHPAPLDVAGRRKDRALFRRAVRSARVVTALSTSAAAGVQKVAGRPALVVPPGLRTDVFTPNLEPRTGPVRILFTADAGDPRKRLGVLLAAMPTVLDRLPDARLVLGGAGGLPAAVDGRVRAAVDDVPGGGALDDVPALYRAATVTVLPSVDEAFGLVLVESLACGTPVVGADSGGIPDIVTAEVGELAKPDDPAALADAIERVAKTAADPTTPARCVAHAERWSWDTVGPEHVAAYRTPTTR